MRADIVVAVLAALCVTVCAAPATLLPGVELFHLSGADRSAQQYQLPWLEAHATYEIKISARSISSFEFDLELAESPLGEEPVSTRMPRRRLLDTTKISFSTDARGLPLYGAEQSGYTQPPVVLVTPRRIGVPTRLGQSLGSSDSPHSVSYNIVLTRLYFGAVPGIGLHLALLIVAIWSIALFIFVPWMLRVWRTTTLKMQGSSYSGEHHAD